MESLTGNILVEVEDKKINLEVLDEININQKIQLDPNAEIVILLDDGTTLVVKGDSIFKISEYEDIFSVNPH